jgi:hypothetical protein
MKLMWSLMSISAPEEKRVFIPPAAFVKIKTLTPT